MTSTTRSVLILKPDAAGTLTGRDLSQQLIREEGLNIFHDYSHQFSYADVLDTWPKYASGRYPISTGFGCAYMTSGPSHIFLVEGVDAVKKCHTVRTRFRQSWGDAMFSNGMHTPTEPYELAPTLAKFADAIPNGTPHQRHEDTGTTDGIFGRLASIAPARLQGIIAAVWQELESLQADPAGCSQLPSLVLLPGDPNSIDFGMSALVEIFPTLTAPEVMKIYLRAEKHSSATIVSAPIEQLQSCFDRLVSLKMNVQLRAADLENKSRGGRLSQRP
ncbi:hypothetical protein [Rhizobium leguminosarum]|uniref:hypothetical protein n=1 Tax=Rhizobium leguminosarum TaxID=384 RepID=UPI003F985F24